MLDDPIVEEVRQAREAYAAKFNFDILALFQDLKKQEQRGDRKVVELPARHVDADDDAGAKLTQVAR